MPLFPKSRRLLIPLAFLTVFGGLIAFLYSVEFQGTSDTGFFTAIETAVIALFGEYPEKPLTLSGRIAMLLILLFGLFFAGVLVGKISSLFVAAKLKGGITMLPKKNHIIICNYNWRTEGIIREIIASQVHSGKIVLITSEENQKIKELQEKYESLVFYRADPTRHDTLKQINAHRATRIILLIDYNVTDSDAKNVFIALSLKKLEKEMSRRSVHIVAELQEKEREQHLRDAGIDEVINTIDLNVGLITQTALFPKMYEVYRRLLTFSHKTNEFYFIEPGFYPTLFYGKSFTEIAALVNKNRSSENPVLLVGIKREGRIMLNPKKEIFTELEQNDSLIVMAYTLVDQIKLS